MQFASATSIRLHATDGRRLAELADERIGFTMLLTRTVPLNGHSPALVTARRQPGTERIIWQVSLSNGTDPRDPEPHPKIAAAIRELRAHVEG